MTNLYHYRKEYNRKKLERDDLLSDPVEQFIKWFKEAEDSGIEEPNIMVLSTAGNNLRPSSRIVLLKDCTNEGFTFFTNYQSKKGKQIEENPFGCILFPWTVMERQIRIEGKLEKLPDNISNKYFQSRPVGSRIGAWSSDQSAEIPSRAFIEKKEKNFRMKYKDEIIPRPPFWGGYVLIPDLFEFWQGRESRLHDRFEYKLINNDWKIARLSP
jgi:pyridoxamine 5'-phosphate oxidase